MAGKRGAETAKSGIHPATPPLPRLMPAHVVIHARSGTTGGRVELDTARARLTDSAQSSATTAPTSASPVIPGPGAGGVAGGAALLCHLSQGRQGNGDSQALTLGLLMSPRCPAAIRDVASARAGRALPRLGNIHSWAGRTLQSLEEWSDGGSPA